MKIHTSFAKEIAGCVTFKHRGYTLSLTTLGFPHEMRIFGPRKGDATKRILGHAPASTGAEDVAMAVQKIDNYLLRTKLERLNRLQ